MNNSPFLFENEDSLFIKGCVFSLAFAFNEAAKIMDFPPLSWIFSGFVAYELIRAGLEDWRNMKSVTYILAGVASIVFSYNTVHEILRDRKICFPLENQKMLVAIDNAYSRKSFFGKNLERDNYNRLAIEGIINTPLSSVRTVFELPYPKPKNIVFSDGLFVCPTVGKEVADKFYSDGFDQFVAVNHIKADWTQEYLSPRPLPQ